MNNVDSLSNFEMGFSEQARSRLVLRCVLGVFAII